MTEGDNVSSESGKGGNGEGWGEDGEGGTFIWEGGKGNFCGERGEEGQLRRGDFTDGY